MVQKNAKFGYFFPILMLSLFGVGFYLTNTISATLLELSLITIPVLIMLISIGTALLAHFSYPRVHNLKVIMTGYLFGILHLAYSINSLIPELYFFTPVRLVLLQIILIVIITLVPEYTRFEISRIVAIGSAVLLASIIGVFQFSIFLRYPTMTAVLLLNPNVTVIAIPVFIVSILLPFFIMRSAFFLGGLLASLPLGTAVIWYSPFFLPLFSNLSPVLNRYIVLLMQVLTLLGILTHWLARIEHRALYDPLLQIYNREYCSKIMSEQASINSTPPFSIALFDIDHFKKVNDTYGHQAGDDVLFHVAQTIQRECIPQGIVCRYGGEEIIVFFPKSDLNTAATLCEKVRIGIEMLRVQTGRRKLSVTISCGVCTRIDRRQTINQIINAADKALYKAKKEGRNRVKTAKIRQR